MTRTYDGWTKVIRESGFFSTDILITKPPPPPTKDDYSQITETSDFQGRPKSSGCDNNCAYVSTADQYK